MRAAPVVYTLWQRVLRFDPSDPIWPIDPSWPSDPIWPSDPTWPNRDRFVLPEGHACALLWSLLHLAGVRAVGPDCEVPNRAAVTLDDLKNLRQLGSHCPGHPEYRWTSGAQTTAGPLGQGVATSAGKALPTLDRTKLSPASGVARGAYVLAEADGGQPEVILLTTGPEVHLALAVRDEPHSDGIATRVVSMPCWELFDRQRKEYRASVIPPSVRARVAVEQASTLGWGGYVGDEGR